MFIFKTETLECHYEYYLLILEALSLLQFEIYTRIYLEHALLVSCAEFSTNV